MITKACIHGCSAFVPSYIDSLMTDRVDEKTGWYPDSNKKLTKEEKSHIYRKLKENVMYNDLSKKQKMLAKCYIRGERIILLVSRTIHEAITQAKRIYNEIR